MLRDCRLCDDLCYVTETWIRCQVCQGSGRQGHLGDLSPDCTACNGVGFTKPGMGVAAGYGMGYGGMPVGGMAPVGGMIPPAGGMYPPAGGMYPPAGGMYPPVGGYGPGYGAAPPHF